MDEHIADARPVLEPDAYLEGGGALTHEVLFVDAEQAMERNDGWYGRFTHTDGADFLGLHQRDLEQLAEMRRQRDRGHPAGGAAAGNNHLPDRAGRGQYVSIHSYPLRTRQ